MYGMFSAKIEKLELYINFASVKCFVYFVLLVV